MLVILPFMYIIFWRFLPSRKNRWGFWPVVLFGVHSRAVPVAWAHVVCLGGNPQTLSDEIEGGVLSLCCWALLTAGRGADGLQTPEADMDAPRNCFSGEQDIPLGFGFLQENFPQHFQAALHTLKKITLHSKKTSQQAKTPPNKTNTHTQNWGKEAKQALQWDPDSLRGNCPSAAPRIHSRTWQHDTGTQSSIPTATTGVYSRSR